MATDENPYLADPPNYTDPEWLYEKYYVENKSIREMAEMEGVSHVTIRRVMEEHDLPRYPSGVGNSLSNGGDIKLYIPDWLYEQYWEEEKSSGEIADLLGCSTPAVINALDRAGIERRSSREAARLRWEREADDE